MGVSLAACGSHPAATVGGIPSTAGAAHSQGYYKIGRPYQIDGVWYYPREDWRYDETGTASWYGEQFHGRYTADGEIFNLNELTAAHRTLPMPVVVRVTNLENGRSMKLRVNDRGPYARGRVIDVSRRAAQLLGFEGQGTTRVRVQIDVPDSIEVASAAGRVGPVPGMSEAVAAIVSAPLALPVAALEAMRAQGQTPPTQPRPANATMLAQTHPVVLPPPQPSAPATPVELADNRPVAVAPLPRPAQPKLAANRPVALPRPASRTVVDDKPYVIDDLPTEPIPPAQAAAASAPPAKVELAALHPNQIFVQAGAFANESNAVRVQSQLRALGSPVSVTAGSTGNGGSIYRVRVGPVASIGAADALVGRIVSSGFAGARIVVD
jgi:rare lipoprotein A